MTAGKRWGAKAAVVGAGTVLALIGGSLGVPASAAPVKAAADECPAAVPVSTVTAGMVGEGLTVAKGSTPEPFKVEVLGVLKNGVGAGRDMILIKVSDYNGSHVIDQGDGIWAGMSGSPVYVGGKLLGAVSYGFSNSPSPIGGLTPAEDMYKVLDLPTQAAGNKGSVQAASKVTLSAAQRKAVAARAGVATPSATLRQLTVPMAVGGLGSRRIDTLQKAADKAGMAVKMYAGGKAAAPTGAPTATLKAGGNFAAVVAYGDATLAGVGTTTAICQGQALAFGHPLMRNGPSNFGANDADALVIIKDATTGPFKMANIGASAGTIDQDRTTALRANLTETPKLSTITTTITNADTGKKRTGTTNVTTQSFVPEASVGGIWANDDNVFDEWNDGTATSSWTISGTRANGKPFSVTRDNRWASQEDITIDPAFDVADAAYSLISNDYEKVNVDKVDFSSTKSTTYQQLHITKIAVKVNDGKYASPKKLSLKAGDKLKIKVYVAGYRDTATKTRTLALTVPAKAKGRSGELSVGGGVDLASFGNDEDLECLLFGECDEANPGSFDKLVSSIEGVTRNDAIQADLNIESKNEDEDYSTVATATKLASLTVTGLKSIAVTVKR